MAFILKSITTTIIKVDIVWSVCVRRCSPVCMWTCGAHHGDTPICSESVYIDSNAAVYALPGTEMLVNTLEQKTRIKFVISKNMFIFRLGCPTNSRQFVKWFCNEGVTCLGASIFIVGWCHTLWAAYIMVCIVYAT